MLNKRVTLHSESSFTIVKKPQIIWFMCIIHLQIIINKTIICDGLKLWERLSDISCKDFFKKEPVEYDVKINLTIKIVVPKKMVFKLSGIYDEFLDLNKNIMTFKYKTFAVEKNYFNSKLFFCKYLLSVKDEAQIRKVSYKEKPISKKYFEEIKNTSEKITYAHT